jgi:hypothetical protein
MALSAPKRFAHFSLVIVLLAQTLSPLQTSSLLPMPDCQHESGSARGVNDNRDCCPDGLPESCCAQMCVVPPGITAAITPAAPAPVSVPTTLLRSAFTERFVTPPTRPPIV